VITFAAMTEFSHDHIKPFSSEGSKKEQVGAMFDSIAPRYDLVNRVLSAGIDVSWRRKAIRCLAADKPGMVLDVATGTADMALMAARMLPGAQIVGIDISEKMLEIGRKKVEEKQLGTKIALHRGDGETINFADNTFDAVMVAFGVRNFEQLDKGLQEILRVLKPGGQLVVLEFSKPRLPGVRSLYNLYMGVIAPQVARWFRQSRKAYSYLNESAKAFPDRQQFDEILKTTGFIHTEWKPLSLGICCIYRGRKP
jgi:demethylmenaquinone methyltransferase/2-methoxy-6-polyprenyl-1,4-benzoquinol methylase